jgi:hypothetical protein
MVERVADISNLQSLLRSIGLIQPSCTDTNIGSIETLISVQFKKLISVQLMLKSRSPGRADTTDAEMADGYSQAGRLPASVRRYATGAIGNGAPRFGAYGAINSVVRKSWPEAQGD